MNSIKLAKINVWPNILIATSLVDYFVIGCVIVRNYELSWNDLPFYNYADNIGSAYSISVRLIAAILFSGIVGIVRLSLYEYACFNAQPAGCKGHFASMTRIIV